MRLIFALPMLSENILTTNMAIKVRFPTLLLPKEMCRKHYIIEQIAGSLHEIRLYNLHLIYIFLI